MSVELNQSPEHTPEPWIIRDDAPKADNGDIAIRNTKGRLVAVLYAHAEARANAHLVATAPDMLSFLKRIGDCTSPDEVHDLVVNYVDDLINKAEGKN